MFPRIRVHLLTALFVGLPEIGLGLTVNVVSNRLPGWVQNNSPIFLVVVFVLAQVGAAWVAGPGRKRRRHRLRTEAVRIVRADTARILDSALGDIPRIPLHLVERPEAVPASPSVTGIDDGVGPGTVQRDDGLLTAFERSGSALLVLGAGGSGKTVLLVELCQDLADRALKDRTERVPVLVGLAGWSRKQGPLERWLRNAVTARYGLPRAFVDELVDDDGLTLLLDGLDEVPKLDRKECLAQLNKLIADRAPLPVVVSCRTETYAPIGSKVRVRRAVEIQNLDNDVAASYLAALRSPTADAVAAVPRHDTDWWRLVTSPLILGMIARIVARDPAATLVSGGSLARRRGQVIDRYIDVMLSRRGKRGEAGPLDSRRWLAWLAHSMREARLSNLPIDRPPVGWLRTFCDPLPIKHQVIKIYVVGAVLSVFAGVVLGVIPGFAISPTAFMMLVPALLIRYDLTKHHTDADGSVHLIARIGAPPFDLLPRALASVLGTLVLAALLPLVLHTPLAWSLALVPAALASEALTLTANSEPRGLPDKEAVVPGFRIRLSTRNAVRGVVFLGAPAAAIIAGASWVTQGPQYVLPTFVGEIGPLCLGAWFISGGTPVAQLRLMLREIHRRGLGPRRYVDFLDSAADRLILRRAGAGYAFVHHHVQKHLALEWQKAQASPSVARTTRKNRPAALKG
ncbi:NACHT domain-containing protein [Streptosporangium sp. NPDC051023]|uniref:NACHT domain-containing protein n=1 Tax=Streptosporangium sp. NPDC051023 TaxID=3155410 RepID=UPI00344CDB17